VFFVEFGFAYLEALEPTWAPRGKRPILRHVGRDRRAVSTAVGFTLSGRIYKRHFEGAMRSAQVIEVLKHLRRHIKGPFVLIWDRANTHRSQLTTAFLREHPDILVEWLPAYAPELNPEEYCHGNVKQHLRNATPTDKAEMRRLLNRGFARLRRRPDLLLSFVHAAGLPVRQLWFS
jgi:transposase